MSSLAFFWPMAACVITGLALYVTRGVLDQTVTSGGVVRFAMLPPWQALVGFICLAGLVLVGIDHLNAPRGTTTGKRPRLGELVLPLLSLIVLLLPFVPVLPDRFPVLQALSGPLGAIVWLAVAALQVWVLWQSRLVTARAIEGLSLTTLTVIVFLVSAAGAGVAGQRLTASPVFPSGDEPHYLIIAQSLWRDGDLKIENNHTRGDYREYFGRDLEPHYLTRGVDQEIYSIHPIGIALLLAPIYGLGGYPLVIKALILMAALAAALAWRWVVDTLNSPGAATFSWAAVMFSAPFLFNAITVYPEIGAALTVMIALPLALRTDPERSGWLPWLIVALAIAALPWLHSKYAPMSAALVMVTAFRLRKKEPASLIASLLGNPKIWMVGAIYAVSLAGWFFFFYYYWGAPWPQAPYGALPQTTPLNWRFGTPGLLFDQEYGLLAFAPAYILAVTGLVHMWRAGGDLRRQSIEVALVFIALLLSVSAHRVWYGGTAAPARPIASGLLVLAMPIAMAFRSAPIGSPRRAGQHLLLWIGIGIATTLTMTQDGLLINNGRDGTSSLLEYWSPRWALWTLAPTFVEHEWLTSLSFSFLWLAIAAGAGLVLAKSRVTRPGAAALVAFATLSGALIVAAVLVPLLPAEPPLPGVDLGARSRLAALDGFDARVRPASVVYDPLRKGATVEVLSQLALSVKPAQRKDQQPIRVIHNGRFSLPAGTYTIEVQFGDRPPDRALPLSLQVGRVGPPLQIWTLQPQAGQRWTTSLWLPVDANFVALRGAVELESAIAAITITPTAVVDAGARPRVPVVLSAAIYRGVSMFFHNEQLFPEPEGFWTIGERSVEVTVATPPGRTAPVVLRIHGGGWPNAAIFSTFGWRKEYSLMPGKTVDVELPIVADGVVPLTIAAKNGFYPKDLDPASKDPRFLGIWVEVLPEGTIPP